jgi:hypothetical protein
VGQAQRGEGAAEDAHAAHEAVDIAVGLVLEGKHVDRQWLEADVDVGELGGGVMRWVAARS